MKIAQILAINFYQICLPILLSIADFLCVCVFKISPFFKCLDFEGILWLRIALASQG